MSNQTIVRQEINFSIALSGLQLNRPERIALEAFIKQAIQALIEALHLPARPALSLRITGPKDAQDRPAMKISILGKKCRICEDHRFDDTGIQALTAEIMAVIHRNRTLLINRTVTRLIGQHDIPEAPPALQQLPLTGLQQLLTLMIERGFSLRRLLSFKPDSETTAWSFRHLFDTIIAPADSTTVRVSYGQAYDQAETRANADRRTELASLMQDGLFYELGIAFPSIIWQVDQGLEPQQFQIQLNDLTYPPVNGLRPDQILVNDTVERLRLLGIQGHPATNPANDRVCTIVDAAHTGLCEDAYLTTWDPLGYLILYLSRQLRQQAGSFLTKDIVENNLDALRLGFPALVDACLSRYDLFMLTWILRDLLDEELSIRDLRAILDHLLLVNGVIGEDLSQFIVLNPEGAHFIPTAATSEAALRFTNYAEYIRTAAYKRYISHKYSRGQLTLTVYLLDPDFENSLRLLGERKIPEAERRALLKTIRQEIDYLSPADPQPVILTTVEIRRRVRKLIEIEFPQLAVLSYQELSPDMNIQPIARISPLEEIT